MRKFAGSYTVGPALRIFVEGYGGLGGIAAVGLEHLEGLEGGFDRSWCLEGSGGGGKGDCNRVSHTLISNKNHTNNS